MPAATRRRCIHSAESPTATPEITVEVNRAQRSPATSSTEAERSSPVTTSSGAGGAVESGHFRMDLYHRLNVYPLRVPPLRERIEDIPLLAGHFCEAAQRQMGLGRVLLHAQSMAVMKAYNWPGNVRELENIITRAVLKACLGVSSDDPVTIFPENLDIAIGMTREAENGALKTADIQAAGGRTLRAAVAEFQRSYILGAVKMHGDNWSAAARRLGIHRSNLHKLAQRLGIK